MVEGIVIDNVVLDLGSACTMVRQDFVHKERLVGGASIRLRCAHGDVVTYPLASVKLEIDGMSLPVTTAVANKLPVSVLLGTNVPELQKLITQSVVQPNALVMTRAQAKASEQTEVRAKDKQEERQVHPNPVEELNPFSDLYDDLFLKPRVCQTPIHQEKRESRQGYGLIRAKDPPRHTQKESETFDMSKKSVQEMQEVDEMLKVIWEGIDQPSQPFFREEGLLYRKWEPRGKVGCEHVN